MAQLPIWDYSVGKRVNTMNLGPVSAPIGSLAFSHNGGILIAGDDEGMLRFFDMRDYKTFQVQFLSTSLCVSFVAALTLCVLFHHKRPRISPMLASWR